MTPLVYRELHRLAPGYLAGERRGHILQTDDTVELIPERLPANAPMHIGERIRFSFESPQTGYLYVIDREQFADGSLGEPVLIFPTTRTRNGDNGVAAGKLVEIPAQEDRPNYFTLQQSRLNNVSQTGEMLTVIITAKPLEGITIGPKALTLTKEQVGQWEKQWGSHMETFDLAGGAGKPWTKAEQEAGASGTRQLTQEDPEPQTIYRVAVKPGEPLLVKVGLRYGGTKAGQNQALSAPHESKLRRDKYDKWRSRRSVPLFANGHPVVAACHPRSVVTSETYLRAQTGRMRRAIQPAIACCRVMANRSIV